jgi:hypothetical protein
LAKLRPNIVKLATECDENDESIGDILKANDQCERIMNQYKSMFDRDDVKLVNISTTIANRTTPTDNNENSSLVDHDLIGNFSNTNNNKMSSNYDPLKELQDLFISKHGDTSNASSINGTSHTAMSNVFDMISNNYGESSLPSSSSSNSLMMPMSTTSALVPKSLMDESSKLD